MKDIKTCIPRLFIAIIALFFLTSTCYAEMIYITRVEHNVAVNGQKSMIVHFRVSSPNLKGKNPQVNLFFDSPKYQGLQDRNGKCCTANGKVAIAQRLPASDSKTEWADFTMTMPNSEIHPLSGNRTYYMRAFLNANSQDYAVSDFWAFDMSSTSLITGSHSSINKASTTNNSKKYSSTKTSISSQNTNKTSSRPQTSTTKRTATQPNNKPSSSSAPSKGAVIKKIWLEHNVKGPKNNSNGLNIHTDFDINGYQGKSCRIIYYIKNSKTGQWVKILNANATKNLTNYIYDNIIPKVNNATYRNFIHFLDYDYLAHEEGKTDFELIATVEDNNFNEIANTRLKAAFQVNYNTRMSLVGGRPYDKDYPNRYATNASTTKTKKTASNNTSTRKSTTTTSNSSSNSNYVTCTKCKGTGKCPICSGKGHGNIGMPMGGKTVFLSCTPCNGTGDCSLCGGSKRITKKQATNYEAFCRAAVQSGILNYTPSSNSSSRSSSSSSSRTSSSSSSCHKCHGSGVDPNPVDIGRDHFTGYQSWSYHFHSGGTGCPYCKTTTKHWHQKCGICNIPRY